MSAERLSGLQKWILTTTEENAGRVPSCDAICRGFWGPDKIYAECLAFHRYHRRGERPCIDKKYIVSVSRSLQNLEDKGLIEPPLFNVAGWHRPWPIELTPRGGQLATNLTRIPAAEFLRICQSMEVNIKPGGGITTVTGHHHDNV